MWRPEELPSLGEVLNMSRLALVALTFAGVASAHAQILIQIDLTNPNQVTINTTSGASLLSLSVGGRSVRLKDFFADGPQDALNYSMDSTGSIKAALSSRHYTQVTQTNAHLQLWTEDPTSQNFQAGTQAFTGSMIADLTSATQYLRTSSFVGDIYVLDSSGAEVGTVGQYSVTAVPEPASLTALGLGAIALLRRRRK